MFYDVEASLKNMIMMKLKYLALLLIPFGLAACQSSDLQKVGDIATSVFQQQNANKTLSAYTWSLNTPNAPKPITLQFSDQGRLSVTTSCNTLATQWTAESNILTTTKTMGTLMACENNVATAQEKLASNLISEAKIPFALNLNNPNNPTLTLVAANGEKYIFNGTMTPETKYQSQAETIFLEIAPGVKKCSGGAGEQMCLSVKEIKYNEQGIKTSQDKDWTYFYSPIEGYKHDPNLQQIIRVKRYEIKNPAADQGKYAYIYDMTVSSAVIK